MNIIGKMWQRDVQILRWICRKIVYPYYRFEHFRLTKTREDMQQIKYISKQDMKNSSKQWKWIYVVKEKHEKKYARNWDLDIKK